MGEPLVRLRGVTKDYHGLRPLRIAEFDLHEAQSVALLGFDAAMAEVLVNLITAATTPDAGEVIVFGNNTRTIRDGNAWATLLDQFGLLTGRAVLVEQLTAEQNLAMPLSLDLHGMAQQAREQVRRVAEEVKLAPSDLSRHTGELSPAAQLRVRLGRALVVDPRVLLAEHPNALLSPNDTLHLAADLARIIAGRRLATLVLTADRRFADTVAQQVFTHQPATGALNAASGWRRWFS